MTKQMLLILSVALGGCAGTQPPTVDSLAHAPLVRFGETPPSGRDFVLHFPAGQPIPVKVDFAGNAFNPPRSETMQVALVRDIYSHKNWVSYDRRTWMDAKDALEFKVDIRIPGYEHPQDGIIQVLMNLKK